jgi:glutamate synthase (NADPH/NADH) small chain
LNYKYLGQFLLPKIYIILQINNINLIFMKKKMLQFITLGQSTPEKRDELQRKKDFNEIYKEFITEKAAEQSSRCSQCGVPFCQIHCPLSNNIPDWLKLSAEGRLREAYELSQSTNNMPEVCGRICPQDRLCEGNCVIEQSGHGTVTIGSIEKYITDTAWKNNWVKPMKVQKELNLSVGIIGAGPAGLACAEELRKLGYKITIYDRYDRPGGLLIYGIPNFKLEKYVVERRTELLRKGGIKFVQNFEVGKNKTLDELRNLHDSILIATGVYKAREIEIPGVNLNNIFPAMDFLTASNKKGLGDKVKLFDNGTLDAKNKDVVVIGGGDTAMDCVRTAVRQKAKSVKCIYRRDRENMPGSAREVANAIEEGVEFVWLASPKQFIGNSEVKEVEINKIKLGLPDSSGRRSPEIEPNTEYKIKADMVIKSLGFDPEDLPNLFNAKELNVSRWGTIKVNLETMQTNLEGVFAAGDIVRGASLVVWAIKDGRDVALQIHKYLRENKNKSKAA